MLEYRECKAESCCCSISTIKSTSEARFNQITITTASGCWTPDRTVSELPVLTQTAAAPLSNYRPPAIDDCPTEPDVDPLNCLPKDSAVLLEVAGVSPEDDLPSLVDVIQLSPESGNPGAPAIDTPADMTPRTPTAPSTAKPGHLTVGRDTASTSKTPFIEAGSFHKLSAIPPQYLRVAMAYNGLPSRYPRVVSAYNALLAAIDECEDPDACDPLQQTLGLHLFLRGYPDSESTEPSDDGSSVESRVVGPPQSLREIPYEPLLLNLWKYYSLALIDCGLVMLALCAERTYTPLYFHATIECAIRVWNGGLSLLWNTTRREFQCPRVVIAGGLFRCTLMTLLMMESERSGIEFVKKRSAGHRLKVRILFK